MSNKLSKISIILFTVASSPLSYPEKLKKLRDIGYQSVQGGIAEGMTLKEQKDLLDSLGMEFSCLGGGFEDIEKNPEKYIEACEYFDCDEIMVGTMPTAHRADYDGYMKAIERMNVMGQALSKGGVYLAYHNHAQEFRRFSNGKTGMDVLFEGLDPAGVHFLPDTHWIQAGGGDIIEWLNKLKGRIQYLHMKDYRIAPTNYNTGIGEVDKQFAEVGQGNLEWPLIIETALSVGIKAFIVEQDRSYGIDPFDCAATSFEALKGFGLS
jgi:Sugar phosphate isomerases/epimerases